MISKFPPRHWNRLFALLSLNGVAELYREIGLELPSNPSFKTALRECIKAARERVGDVSAGSVTAHELILGCLQARLGEPLYEKFLSWAATAFLGHHADQPDFSVWDIVFSHWATGRYRPDGVDPVKMSDLIDRYRASSNTADVDARIAELKKRPLCDWDVEIYNRHGFNHFDQLKDPYLAIRLMIRIHRIQLLLGHALKDLYSQELDALRQSAQQLVDRLHVWMPGPVPSIASLGRH